MTRRGLIERALLVAGIPWLGCASRRDGAGVAPNARAPAAPASSSGMPSAGEMDDLAAFGEVLVEGRALAPAERRQPLAHLGERAARSPEAASVYRAAAATLNRLAGRRFATLAVAERIALVARHRLAVPDGTAEEAAADVRALRARTAPDLIRGYYGSAAGWAAVGYDAFPGRCGDLTRYTRPEA
jgi:hypothetical protein